MRLLIDGFGIVKTEIEEMGEEELFIRERIYVKGRNRGTFWGI